MPESQIAVVGAGRMGHGIAQVFAAAGYRVTVYDPDPATRASVTDRIGGIFELLEQDPAGLDRIEVFDTLESTVSDADFVFEAGPEKLPVKRALFARLIELTGPQCILTSNTSALPIGRISESLPDARRIAGTHFWNPPYLVPLVEVVQSADTAPEVVAQTLHLLEAAQMKPVHVKRDVRGFIGNRLQHALKREAIALVSRGVCSAETIDIVCRYGFGLRLPALGPMEQSDLVGLDLTADILTTVLPALDTSASLPKLLADKIEGGELGMKTGCGFRNWTPESAAETRDRLHRHLLAARRSREHRLDSPP